LAAALVEPTACQ